ncbi:hypothetical protein OsJ_24257 [Oryza sativa Japonica Group]|uniref:Uncharacterized protein n=1 Tax=Oryza sativa subsp. japonica TaxID=39947 RepID=B9FX83_ORYSJ|nr:hypothetical protein OsJ_24257 [Oryza sativa Japonica Group]
MAATSRSTASIAAASSLGPGGGAAAAGEGAEEGEGEGSSGGSGKAAAAADPNLGADNASPLLSDCTGEVVPVKVELGPRQERHEVEHVKTTTEPQPPDLQFRIRHHEET